LPPSCVVLAAFMLAVTPLMALLLARGDTVAAMGLIALIGFATIGNFSLTIVMGQEYLPGRPALASGITLGLAIGMGGLIAAASGRLAEPFAIPAFCESLPPCRALLSSDGWRAGCASAQRTAWRVNRWLWRMS
jgi:hypothetical protein